MKFLRLKLKDESFAVKEVISQLRSGNSLYACIITHTTALGNLFLFLFLFYGAFDFSYAYWNVGGG